MGMIITPCISTQELESGHRIVWYDRTINNVLKRSIFSQHGIKKDGGASA